MPVIENRLITSTDWKPGDEPRDGLGLCHNGYHWDVRDCIIDLTNAPKGSVDEAASVTWGSSASFTNCVIRGAGKLVLCGCGDDDKVHLEQGKVVTFKHCILENFSRRGPEVQNGMVCHLNDCLVYNWGDNDLFDIRAFGAWAHKGGSIFARNTVFVQDNDPTLKHWFQDHINHFGQAVNERGFFKALFHRDAWLSGYKRALTAGPDGYVVAMNCYASAGLVLDNWESDMSDTDVINLVTELKLMKQELGRTLDWRY